MNIIAAVDFSRTTDRVLNAAKEYAQKLDADIYLAHVEPGDAEEVLNSDFNVTCVCARDMKLESIQLRKNADTLQRTGIKTFPVIMQGVTSKMILSLAKQLEACLIIIGAHGHGKISSTIPLGHVSKDVLLKSTIPVIVVPTH